MSSPCKKINVLYITSLLDRMGGAEKNLCEVVLHLNRDEFSPFVLAFKGGYLTTYLANENIAVQENGINKLFSRHTLSRAHDLYRFIRKKDIDILVTYHHDADIVGSLVARLAGVPVIASRRDMGYQLESKHIWFYRLFNRIFARFITVSDAVKNEIVQREWINPQKVTTIHNGLSPEFFERGEVKRVLAAEIGLRPGQIVIGMVASFRPIKGQEFLVEAVAKLIEDFPDIQVIIVGYNDNEYFQKVFDRIQELHLEEHFIFTGSRNDVPDLLTLFDIFVLSSLHEGFSNAIIEAMAAGKPVIAPDSGGNSEAVEHGETGLLFTPCDSSSLAEKLRILLGDQTTRTNMGNNGRRAVDKKFRLEQMVAKNENLLQEVVGHG